MCELVVSEVVCPSKPLATLEAGEGALVCVGSLVDLQVVALAELPVAELANVSLSWLLARRVTGSRRRVGYGGQEQLLEVVWKKVARVEGWHGKGSHGSWCDGGQEQTEQ